MTTANRNALRVEYMQPFVDSTKRLFQTRLKDTLAVDRVRINLTGLPAHDLSGVIWLSGRIIGRALISFPQDVAKAVAMEFTEMDPLPAGALKETVRELSAIVAGHMKPSLEPRAVLISPPKVIEGRGFIIPPRKGAICVSIPCTCRHGKLQLEICIVGNG